MGRAAQENEGGEQEEERPEHKVPPSASDYGEAEGNGEISEADAGVGECTGPDEGGLPQQTKSVRREAGRIEQALA